MNELPRDVWIKYRDGDKDAYRNIVHAYLPLTKYVASMMSKKLPPSVEFDDLVSYGTMGLLDAIEKYDLGKNVKFGTYAVSRIRGAILDELRSLDWVPRSVRTKARTVESACFKLSQDLGRPPTNEEMAHELGLNMAEFSTLVNDATTPRLVSLSGGRQMMYGAGRLVEDSESRSPADSLVDLSVDDPLSSTVSGEVAEVMAAVVSRLDGRQRTVLALYCVEELTLSEIGDVLGVTESRVSQMHTRTVRAIQGELEARGAGVAAAV